MLVIDKPAGLPVHPGPKGGPALTTYLDALRFGLPRLPELAHRLDKDTSGCLVLGRHPKALALLGRLFKQNRVSKTYWAVVEGEVAGEEGTIDLRLGRRDPERGWWMKVDPEGQEATTLWSVLGRVEGLTALALKPVTGRTHQLRVHMQAIGHPIVGDPIYGTAPRQGGAPLHLHARRIEIPLEAGKPPVVAEAPVPIHMLERLKRCGVTHENPESLRLPG